MPPKRKLGEDEFKPKKTMMKKSKTKSGEKLSSESEAGSPGSKADSTSLAVHEQKTEAGRPQEPKRKQSKKPKTRTGEKHPSESKGRRSRSHSSATDEQKTETGRPKRKRSDSDKDSILRVQTSNSDAALIPESVPLPDSPVPQGSSVDPAPFSSPESPWPEAPPAPEAPEAAISPSPARSERKRWSVPQEVFPPYFSFSACKIRSVKASNWDSLKSCSGSSEGANGVLFLCCSDSEGSDEIIVVKRMGDREEFIRVFFADFPAKFAGFQVPQIRYLESAEQDSLQRALEKLYANHTDLWPSSRAARLTNGGDLFLMEFIKGESLANTNRKLVEQDWQNIGGLLAFDILIRNVDRFPCHKAWLRHISGNPGNVMLGQKAGQMYAIDQSLVVDQAFGKRYEDCVKSVLEDVRLDIESAKSPSKAAIQRRLSNARAPLSSTIEMLAGFVSRSIEKREDAMPREEHIRWLREGFAHSVRNLSNFEGKIEDIVQAAQERISPASSLYSDFSKIIRPAIEPIHRLLNIYLQYRHKLLPQQAMSTPQPARPPPSPVTPARKSPDSRRKSPDSRRKSPDSRRKSPDSRRTSSPFLTPPSGLRRAVSDSPAQASPRHAVGCIMM